MNIVLIAGSPRKGSVSRRVALYLQQRLADNENHELHFVDMQHSSLPPIQNVWSSPAHAPEQFRELAELVFQADAFILVSPEYNGGYSPAMKNFLDHFPKQVRKTFGICTSSTGAMAGMRAAQQLLQLVPALFGIASPTLLLVGEADKKFSEDGALLDKAFESKVDNFLADFLWLAEAVQAKKEGVRKDG